LRRRDRDGDREETVAFEHWSQRDLVDVVSDHLIEGDRAASTSQWRPSRRGNSPHHNG